MLHYEVLHAMRFALTLSATKDNWLKNTQEVIGMTKEMFFTNVKVKSVEGYGQYVKAELNSTIRSATEFDRFIRDYCYTNKESPKVATWRFDCLFNS